ncbi:MAG: amidohydrolase family protein [Pelomonas sp.]|nr:amidohydrolase family protein [Roseateles sp.]
MQLGRRHLLCCGAAVAAGLFTRLGRAAILNPCESGALPAELHDFVQQSLAGLDPQQLWDSHCHLLGTGDAGSGCRIHPSLTQWWHPVESLRRRFILNGACVAPDVPSVDRAYVERLHALAADFPAGARWLLFAFDAAFDAAGRERPEWTTFYVPNDYAREVAAADPARFVWVASIHPYRADALARLDAAIAAGAVALKWLPSSMNIDLRDARLKPFYDRLARARMPLIVHCGEERAVPGAGRDELGNPLLLRAPLAQGVTCIAAHCASLGSALDLDQRRPGRADAFALFARLMDERHPKLLGDVSALFQVNRDAAVWRTVLTRVDWHPRLLHGSDYPLPGVGPLFRPAALAHAGLLAEAEVAPLERLREHNPLLFDLALQRRARWQGQSLSPEVFATRHHFEGLTSSPSSAKAQA